LQGFDRKEKTMRLRIVAASLLALALALPLLSVPAGLAESPRIYRWPLQEASGGVFDVVLVLLAFLWPVAVLALPRILKKITEPLLALLSSAFIMLMVSVAFEFRSLFVIFFLPVSARAEIGCYVALVANVLFLAHWLWEVVTLPAPRQHGLAV
jgi:hypothetical protein